jgi:hypothetical protein
MSAKRFWEGHIYKGAAEIGYANGTFSVDRGTQYFQQIGDYDLTARRDATREITVSIDHGYVDQALFGSLVTGANALYTFDIHASFSSFAMKFSGCNIESWELEVPQDGWIQESISLRVKTVHNGW